MATAIVNSKSDVYRDKLRAENLEGKTLRFDLALEVSEDDNVELAEGEKKPMRLRVRGMPFMQKTDRGYYSLMIETGALDESLKDIHSGKAVCFLAGDSHQLDPASALASTAIESGPGSLKVTADSDAVNLEAELWQDEKAEALYAKAGKLINKASAGLYIEKARYEDNEETGEFLRVVEKARLQEVSLVCHPAYEDTSVEVMSKLSEFLNGDQIKKLLVLLEGDADEGDSENDSEGEEAGEENSEADETAGEDSEAEGEEAGEDSEEAGETDDSLSAKVSFKLNQELWNEALEVGKQAIRDHLNKHKGELLVFADDKIETADADDLLVGSSSANSPETGLAGILSQLALSGSDSGEDNRQADKQTAANPSVEVS